MPTGRQGKRAGGAFVAFRPTEPAREGCGFAQQMRESPTVHHFESRPLQGAFFMSALPESDSAAHVKAYWRFFPAIARALYTRSHQRVSARPHERAVLQLHHGILSFHKRTSGSCFASPCANPLSCVQRTSNKAMPAVA